MTAGKLSLKARLAAALTHKPGLELPPERKLALEREKPLDAKAISSPKPPAEGPATLKKAAPAAAGKPATSPRPKPGKAAAAKKFLDKKPSARVIGAALLEELYRNAEVGKLLTDGVVAKQVSESLEHKVAAANAAENAHADSTTVSSAADDGDDDEVGDESRLATQLRSSMRRQTHLVPRINKHVSFYGQDGAECTCIYLYEAVKVKLPWTGPKLSAENDRAGEWLRKQAAQAGSARSAARPRLF